MTERVGTMARRLDDARRRRVPTPPLTADPSSPLDSVEDAYAVQAAGVRLRESEGERIVGGKLGFTSAAMRAAMGVDEPNFGWLTDQMVLPDGRVVLDELIHPKVEPEIAFLLDTDLPKPVTTAAVLAGTRAVMPCLEIVDSRFVDFRFGPLDNIADNSSAGRVALGDPVAPDDLDLRTMGVVVSVDGLVRATAAGAAALDHPAAAVAWMANRAPRPLMAGDVVISGGLTAPVTLTPGMTVTAEFDRIGSVTITTE